MGVADIGRNHLRDALAGEMKSIEVPEWKDDDGNPVIIYFKPLIGKDQILIEAMYKNSEVQGICMSVKLRALNKDGSKIFNVPIESLLHDYSYSDIIGIFLKMTIDAPASADPVDKLDKLSKE